MRVSQYFQLGFNAPWAWLCRCWHHQRHLPIRRSANAACNRFWVGRWVGASGTKFRQEVLDAVHAGDQPRGQRLLGYLREP